MGAAAAAGDAAADPLPAASDPDLAISVFGITLFQEGSAFAASDFGDIAIAVGPNSNAVANNGILDFAFADGTNSHTQSGFGILDFATATGTDSQAVAVGGSLDFATANGSSTAEAGFNRSFDWAFADGIGSRAEAVSNANLDFATVVGNNSQAFAEIGTGEFATTIGNNSTASALNGTLASAAVFGANSRAATQGIGDFAAVVDPGSNGDSAVAGGDSTGTGSFDIAAVVGSGSTADAGADISGSGNFDLAAVFSDMLNVMATGDNGLIDILP